MNQPSTTNTWGAYIFLQAKSWLQGLHFDDLEKLSSPTTAFIAADG